MEEITQKESEPIASAGSVNPATCTPSVHVQPTPALDVPPPHPKISQPNGSPVAAKPIPTTVPGVQSGIGAELLTVKRAWQKYRTTNERDAVYFYLEAVFALVRRWQRLNCAQKNSRAALGLQANAPRMKPEPFGIVIYCTCDPGVADGKTRSKWSRALRFARKAKPVDQRLTDFIKSSGGINECARRFAQNRGCGWNNASG